jgi:hypothetical protein
MDKTARILLFVFTTFVVQVSWAQDDPAENPQFKEAIKDFQEGRLGAAKSGLSTLVELEPKQQIYWFNLCHVYYKYNNFPKASDCYQRVRGLEGSLALPASYYQAVCENNMGRSKKAQEALSKVIDDSRAPENLVAKARHLKKAMAEGEDEASAAALTYFNQGDYEKSLKEIEKSDLSETPEAFLLRGMSYKSLHKMEEAKKYLQLTERYTQKPDIRESSRILSADLNEKEEPVSRTGFGGMILFDVGSDSNIYQVNSASSSSVTNLSLEVDYQKNLAPQWTLAPGYSFKHSQYAKDSSLKTTDHFFVLDLEYAPTNWNFELAPFLELTQSTYDVVSLGGDYLVKLEYEKWGLGFSGSTLQQESRSAAENYLNGRLQTSKFFLEIKNSVAMLQLYASSLRSATGDMPITGGTQSGMLPLAYSGTEMGLYSIVSITNSLRFYGRLSMIAKDYDNISTPSNVKRRDLASNIFLKMKYRFNSGWSGFAALNFSNNQSTLGSNDIENKNYSELINKIGLQWSW